MRGCLLQALEIFDELEEWWLIQSHYFLGVLLRPAPPQVSPGSLLRPRRAAG